MSNLKSLKIENLKIFFVNFNFCIEQFCKFNLNTKQILKKQLKSNFWQLKYLSFIVGLKGGFVWLIW